MNTKRAVRIAVFYDGSFYSNLSTYYRHVHSRRNWLDFDWVHGFIRRKVAQAEEVGAELCQIVEAHFFRGRFSLATAKLNNKLESDRQIDEMLMRANIVSHYYPINENKSPPEEKGIDVWLALEAFDLTITKKFDVVVLFAGDQDFVPLVRKINGLGARVMVIADNCEWEFNEKRLHIKGSPKLLSEAAYPVILSQEFEKMAAPPGEAAKSD